MATKHLVIIPGVGDRHWIYNYAAKWWKMFGFTPHIHVFGWNSADPASKTARQQALVNYILSLDGDIYMLGVSAGGTAAINCFATIPDHILRVATLCSPLAPFRKPVNPLLEVCIGDVTSAISGMDPSYRQRIRSIYALFDNVVPIKLSRPSGIKTVTLPSILHPVTIFLGLTIFNLPILYFFKQR